MIKKLWDSSGLIGAFFVSEESGWNVTESVTG